MMMIDGSNNKFNFTFFKILETCERNVNYIENGSN